MDIVQAELIEKYQILISENPKSKVFAPLAEAYRKVGLKKEALDVAKDGISHNPEFASGYVALARIYIDQGQHQEALPQLIRAVALSPENALALNLLGETRLALRQPKEALDAYKMLLFLNPNHKKAKDRVRRLEPLTANDYESSVFELKPITTQGEADGEGGETPPQIDELPSSHGSDQPEQVKLNQDLDRFLSLSDAYLVRNDLQNSLQTLANAEAIYGLVPEIQDRLHALKGRTEPLKAQPSSSRSFVQEPPLRPMGAKTEKIERLKSILKRVQNREIP